MKVIIYTLIDPRNLKVRYIGRTRCSLIKRLREHVCKSSRNYCKTHKGAWIRSILKDNLKPIIRKLVEVEGWEESHLVEQQLINKYNSRLVNHKDKGCGGKNQIISDDTKAKIQKTLKEFYKEGNPNFSRKVYVYDLYDNLLFVYDSIIKCSKDLNISYSRLQKHLRGERYKPISSVYKFKFN